MSYNVASLLRGWTESESTARNSKLDADDSIGEQQRLSSERACSCDICSFKKLKDLEKNLTPGLPMPHLSSMTSPFSQVNTHTDTYLAPRTGHEQPYWYRPSYFGWQYVTSASHVTHHSSFLQLKNAPTAEFQLERYHETKYQATRCHATEYQSNGCHATEYQTTDCHESGHHATECHESGYHATECHGSGYQPTECYPTEYHAGGYHALASENRIVRTLGGLAYDHVEFPKIVSVHSMAESHYTMQEHSGDSNPGNDIRSDSVEAEPHMPGPVPITGLSLCGDNSTVASNGYTNPLASEICVNTEYHGSDDDDQSSCHSLRTSMTESEIVCESATENKSTATILSKTGTQSTPAQSMSNIKPCAEGSRLQPPNAASSLQNGRLCATAEECESSENAKMPCSITKSSNLVGGSPECDSETTVSTKEPSTQTRALLVTAKKRKLILHRIQRINNIQTRLKHENCQSLRTRLIKNITILKKEIQHLSKGSFDESSSEVINIRKGNPLNSAPVKMSPSAPNKEMMQRTRKVDSEFSDQTTEIWKSSSEVMNVNSTMGKSISSEQPDGKLPDNGFRMNVFEKLGLLHGSSQNNPRSVSELTSACVSKNTETSQVIKASVENVFEEVSKRNDERYVPQFNGVYSKDGQGLKESGQIVVKSAEINTEDTLEYSSEAYENTLNPELPDSWTSAHVSKNHSEPNESLEKLKRKQQDVNTSNDEPAKRRCKTLPRKVVRKDALGMAFHADVYLDETPLQGGESEEIGQEWESVSTMTEGSDKRENSDCKLGTFADSGNNGNDDNTDINLSIKPDTDFIAPRVYEDDALQRNLELRKSKICDLIRKQKGLLQTIEQMATKPQPNDQLSLIP